MANVVEVLKLNPELQALKKQIESQGMTYEELIQDKELCNHLLKQTGLDFSKIEFKDFYPMWLDLDKVLAVGEIEDVPGMDNLKGFAIWFDSEAKHCWYLDPECYNTVVKIFRHV